MDCKKAFIILAILLPTFVSAKDIIVGDDKGWRTHFDYQAWAKGKDFRVGDRLIFRYDVGDHNVIKVNQTNFQYCIKESLSAILTTGYDIVELQTPGPKWYICGIKQHCAVGGLKLAIFVKPAHK